MGLAAYLLGIDSQKQISRDPLRGNLFENMVVIEVLKYRFNQGQRSNLYFYRDSKGNEIDLLLVYGTDIFPIEIKAGMTITRDYFKGLNHFAKVFPDHIPKGGGLVYAGDQSQSRTNVMVVSYSNLNTILSAASNIIL